jgi:hypothetical protein
VVGCEFAGGLFVLFADAGPVSLRSMISGGGGVLNAVARENPARKILTITTVSSSHRCVRSFAAH